MKDDGPPIGRTYRVAAVVTVQAYGAVEVVARSEEEARALALPPNADEYASPIWQQSGWQVDWTTAEGITITTIDDEGAASTPEPRCPVGASEEPPAAEAADRNGWTDPAEAAALFEKLAGLAIHPLERAQYVGAARLVREWHISPSPVTENTASGSEAPPIEPGKGGS